MSDDEVYRVLDPDPPGRRSTMKNTANEFGEKSAPNANGVNEVGEKSAPNANGVNEVGEKSVRNANLVSGGAEIISNFRKKPMPKNSIKARLIQETLKDLEKAVEEARVSKKVNTERMETNVDVCEENVGEENVNGLQCVTEESYASRAARTTVTSDRAVSRKESVDNKPGRPCTAFFTPNQNTGAKSVFDALDEANISEKDIWCLHRRQGGEVQITFRTKALKEKLLALNSLRIGDAY